MKWYANALLMLSETQWQYRVGNKDFCLLSSSTMLLCIAHRKNRNVMMIYDQIEKDAVSVECWMQRCYCDLVRNVVYDNFQDILVPESDSYSALGITRNSLRASSYISTVHSCNLNNKPLGHNNVSLLGVCCLMGRIWQLPHAMNLAWVLPGGEKCLVYS